MKKLFFVIALAIGCAISVSSASAAVDDAILDWAHAFGDSGYDEPYGITRDALGNTYVVGYFEGTVDFDPGAGTENLTDQGNGDAFVVKLNSSGNLVWARSVGSADTDYANAVTVASDGSVYVTGPFSDTADFDPGAGTTNLVSTGGYDVFIWKLSSSGNLVWAKSIGGTQNDSGASIDLDGEGDLLVSGAFSTTVDFDPNVGTSTLVGLGDPDSFVMKLDASGNFVWARNSGGVGATMTADAVRHDSSDNVFVVGQFSDTVDLDPGVGTSSVTSNGGWDAYVQKLDASGNLLWAKTMGGTDGFDRATSLGIDESDDAYIGGYFGGTVDFDPGAGTSNATADGRDAFIVKLGSSGSYVWSKTLGGSQSDNLNALAVDATGVYAGGSFADTVDFDPGAGTVEMTSADTAGYVLKLDQDGAYLWAKTLGAGADIAYATGLAVTAERDVKVTGYFEGSGDFDPGAGTDSLSEAGGGDTFVLSLRAPRVPSVMTVDATAIGRRTAQLSASILSSDATVTERGFAYEGKGRSATSSQADGSYGTGAFQIDIEDLTCGTRYNYRAYAVSENGMGIGNTQSFRTEDCPESRSRGNDASSTEKVTTPAVTTPATVTPPQADVPDLLPRTLGIGSTGDDVLALQKFLNAQGFILTTAGPGAPGQETMFYGRATAAAVTRLQEAFAAEVLAPIQLTQGTGYVGERTRSLINRLARQGR